MSRLLTGFLALIAFGLAACDNTDANRQESVAKADVSSASLPEVVESLPQSPSPGSAHEEDAAEMLWIDYACDSGETFAQATSTTRKALRPISKLMAGTTRSTA